MKYFVGQVAKLLEVSVPALHYYESTGLLLRIERDKMGKRIYSQQDIEWIRMIVLMRKAGVSIEDIRSYVVLLKEGTKTINDRYELVKSYRDKMAEKIKDMQQSLSWIDAKIEFYQERIKGTETKHTFEEEAKLFRDSIDIEAVQNRTI